MVKAHNSFDFGLIEGYPWVVVKIYRNNEAAPWRRLAFPSQDRNMNEVCVEGHSCIIVPHSKLPMFEIIPRGLSLSNHAVLSALKALKTPVIKFGGLQFVAETLTEKDFIVYARSVISLSE